MALQVARIDNGKNQHGGANLSTTKKRHYARPTTIA